MKRLLPLLLALAGCDFAFGNGDDQMCGQTGVVEGYPVQELHDPYSNTCVGYGYGGGGGYCDPSCGPCPLTPEAPVAQPPPYGACYSECTGLAEDACLAAAGCQASYLEEGPNAMPSFNGCWAVATGGPDIGGACEGRDALACAEDDFCVAYYSSGFLGTLRDSIAQAQTFERCGTEPTKNGCETLDCGPGSHCEQQCAPCADPTGQCPCAPTCVPDQGSCAVVDCQPDSTCIEVCDGATPTDGGAMVPAMCHAECIPTGGGDPGSCSGPVTCFANPPACPANTVPGILNGCWSGYCIPQADCGPHDPGGCEPATCATPGPACPPGTVGGTANGCWTGYCIPATSCPQAACEQLTTEGACTARADCQPVYQGSSCTCDPVCTCEELTFDHCSSGFMSPPAL